jgi:hypothetical protein
MKWMQEWSGQLGKTESLIEELWPHRAGGDPEHRENIALPKRERLFFYLPSLFWDSLVDLRGAGSGRLAVEGSGRGEVGVEEPYERGSCE